MKILNAAIGLGCVMALVAGAQTAQATSPKGKSFHVTVYTSFKTQFDDCFSFGVDGSLLILGFGPIRYRLDELNSQPDAWQAIGEAPGFVGLALHGTTAGPGAQTIRANGMSSDGDTYILQGVLDPSCAADTARRAGGSRYRR